MELNFLYPYFLGPNAENQRLLEKFVLEFLRDHAYWRRNFHPEDGHAIPTSAHFREQFLEPIANMRRELRELSSELKNAAPFYSPRYIGHMNSDLLLPGLIAQIMTTIYNPNNVAAEAGPATVHRELEVGRQLAAMFGYNTDPRKSPCAWGHLTSGGTLANYQGLWILREMKFYPLAFADAAARAGFDCEVSGPIPKPLSDYDKWELLNFSIADTCSLVGQALGFMRESAWSEPRIAAFLQDVRASSFAALGAAEFFHRHRGIRPPKVIAPITAHYSWEKAMKILGFGTRQLVSVKTDGRMRLHAGHLRELLDRETADKNPVLAVIGVLGGTEFSSIDPLHEIVAAREEYYAKGAYFGIHVDAAWGGYMASMFRRENGTFCEREEVGADLRFFPTEDVYLAFEALNRADSITVDPHKLGYLPYPSGAFVCRDMTVVDFISQKASYLYDIRDDRASKSRLEKLRNLGQFILEGSKPGAAAAAAYVSHRVLPLHKHGFGQIVKTTIQGCEYFYQRLRILAKKMDRHVKITLPFPPDTNIICFAINPKANKDLALMNHFSRQVFENIKIDREKPLQLKHFIGSYTSLHKDKIEAEQGERILLELGIDPASFRRYPRTGQYDSDHIFLVRHSLMSPWLLKEVNGRNYIDHYCDYLESAILRELQADGGKHNGRG